MPLSVSRHLTFVAQHEGRVTPERMVLHPGRFWHDLDALDAAPCGPQLRAALLQRLKVPQPHVAVAAMAAEGVVRPAANQAHAVHAKCCATPADAARCTKMFDCIGKEWCDRRGGHVAPCTMYEWSE
jgi:hypothetical protein